MAAPEPTPRRAESTHDASPDGPAHARRAAAMAALRGAAAPSPAPSPPWHHAASLVTRLRTSAGQHRWASALPAILSVAVIAGIATLALRVGGTNTPVSGASVVTPGPVMPPKAVTSVVTVDNADSLPATKETVVPDLLVAAAGAVERPGLYRLAPGARVEDLVRAAGGLRLDADVDRINVAAVLIDGSRLYVPTKGERGSVPPSVHPADRSSDPGLPSDGTPTDSAPAEPIDINTANQEQLESLPGVGPATAQAVIAHRRAHGPFTAVDQLANVRGIGPAKLAQIRPLVRI